MTDLRAFLRHGTRDRHDRVDSAFSALDLATRRDYGHFLRAHHAALAPLEAARRAADWPADLPGPLDAAALIADDLADLGLPLPDSVPVPDRFEPVGVTYVLAGSRMGNKILRRAVLDSPLLLPSRYVGDAALDSYGRDFLRELGQRDAGDGAEHILAGAIAAFASFEEAAIAVTAEVAA